MFISSDRYMPDWKWELLSDFDEKLARIYANRHSRLFCQGQLNLWNSDLSKSINLINAKSTPNQQ